MSLDDDRADFAEEYARDAHTPEEALDEMTDDELRTRRLNNLHACQDLVLEARNIVMEAVRMQRFGGLASIGVLELASQRLEGVWLRLDRILTLEGR